MTDTLYDQLYELQQSNPGALIIKVQSITMTKLPGIDKPHADTRFSPAYFAVVCPICSAIVINGLVHMNAMHT